MIKFVTPAASWGGRTDGTPQWNVARLGSQFPMGVPEMRRDLAQSIYAACGVPGELIKAGEGTASRESWRRFLLSTMTPLADRIAGEATAKLGARVKVSFDHLYSDLATKAWAFQGMVNGGMSTDQAASISGLMDAEGTLTEKN